MAKIRKLENKTGLYRYMSNMYRYKLVKKDQNRNCTSTSSKCTGTSLRKVPRMCIFSPFFMHFSIPNQIYTSYTLQNHFQFTFFFFWMNKNLFPKGQTPTKNTHEVKKTTKKNEKRTAPPLKQRKRGHQPETKIHLINGSQSPTYGQNQHKQPNKPPAPNTHIRALPTKQPSKTPQPGESKQNFQFTLESLFYSIHLSFLIFFQNLSISCARQASQVGHDRLSVLCFLPDKC